MRMTFVPFVISFGKLSEGQQKRVWVLEICERIDI